MIPWLLIVLLTKPPPFDGASMATMASDAVVAGQRVSRSHEMAPDSASTGEGGEIVISRIDINIGNVFNPEIEDEDHRIFRLANRLHRVTRDAVVARQLLFRVGDVLDPVLLEESERLLRQERYLWEPRIEYETTGDGQEAVVTVDTHDVWTLNAGLNYSHKGGTNRSSLQLSDSNFLGWGKDLLFRSLSDVDRDTLQVRYLDPRWRGGRSRLGLEVEDRSDGDLARFYFERPFIALDDSRSWGLDVLDEERDDARYFRGHVADHFHHEVQQVDIYWGSSPGRGEDPRIRRLRFGWSYREDLFSEALIALEDPDPSDSGSLPWSLPTPQDRALSTLWGEWEVFEDAFEETRNLDKIGRTEDRNLGPWLRLRGGVSLAALGASHDSLLVKLEIGDSGQPAERWLLVGSAYLEGRYDLSGGAPGRARAGGFENVRLGAEGRFYRRSVDGRRALFVRGQADYVIDPDPEIQLLLGGDSGLRGYPLRFQDGDRRLLLTLEERLYTHWTLFSLVDVGAAVFTDVGRSWDPAAPADPGSGFLADVGVGIRLGMKRSGRGAVLHLDLAMPLVGDQDIAGLQWLVSSRQSF